MTNNQFSLRGCLHGRARSFLLGLLGLHAEIAARVVTKKRRN